MTGGKRGKQKYMPIIVKKNETKIKTNDIVLLPTQLFPLYKNSSF